MTESLKSMTTGSSFVVQFVIANYVDTNSTEYPAEREFNYPSVRLSVCPLVRWRSLQRAQRPMQARRLRPAM